MKIPAMYAGKLSAASVILCSSFALAAAGCSGSKDSTKSDSAMAAAPAASTAATPPAAQAAPANEPLLFRGTVTSVSADQLALKSDTGTVTVKTTQPFHIYQQAPGKLADVKDSTFIGVTTVKQADGSERATEIHIFPAELRGLGEGSRMMGADTTKSKSRMTNGSVSGSRMTNGAASQSRMSNGSVSNKNGSTFVVQYAGGSQTVTVPPNTPVSEITLTPKTLATGDKVTVLATKAADGSLTSDKAFIAAKK